MTIGGKYKHYLCRDFGTELEPCVSRILVVAVNLRVAHFSRTMHVVACCFQIVRSHTNGGRREIFQNRNPLEYVWEADRVTLRCNVNCIRRALHCVMLKLSCVVYRSLFRPTNAPCTPTSSLGSSRTSLDFVPI